MSPIVTIGNVCLGLAFAFSLAGLVLFATARKLSLASMNANLSSWGRGTVYGNFILMTVATLAMIFALLSNDFGVGYVAQVGAREVPRWVSAVSLWSSLNGSILLWIWILTALSTLCVFIYREQKEALFSSVGFVLLGVQIFFFVLLAGPANPFLPIIPAPANGPGPNPLLQNHWLMVLHPPTLYIGYIGYTIPFAFALASLLEEKFPDFWVVLIRRWSLFAWSFLSMAIVLGGWWSYAVLGWGGYWAWDPVENASLMPWLTGTALLHSVMAQEKRRLFARWNVLLAVLTFLLTILGTFLTRSGVLDSVHSFTESNIGPYFLAFIGVIFAVSLALLIWRAPQLDNEGKVESLLSREILFLFNNLLLLGACLIVILGTLYPIAAELISGQKISIGQPYFNQMIVPMTALIVALMGLGFIFPWGRGDLHLIFKQIRLPALLALAGTILLAVLGVHTPSLLLFLLLILFSFLIMKIDWLKRLKQGGFLSSSRAPLGAVELFRRSPRRFGGMLAHTGFLILIIGVGFSSIYQKEQNFTLKEGASASFDGYELVFEGMEGRQTPQRFEASAVIAVYQGSRELTVLLPRLNFYPASKEPISTPAIRSTPFSDLYLTLIHFEDNGSEASIRAVSSPAVSWIWIGGGLMMVAGLLTMVVRKKRVL